MSLGIKKENEIVEPDLIDGDELIYTVRTPVNVEEIRSHEKLTRGEIVKRVMERHGWPVT